MEKNKDCYNSRDGYIGAGDWGIRGGYIQFNA